ncbi:hypothetical protein TW85_11620 [Marinomonas sp. S3726]|uniref:hypothetical protein n=1 Tax=Marinomonas sp. S3726 TaxID=579484 RepID=UPI0005F9E6D0|nr:hypothetical protein [Marinomonas sp. S3726]KJZ13839.1 hypothetical protein TW85_11620 [Marinomonas sp. S3726]
MSVKLKLSFIAFVSMFLVACGSVQTKSVAEIEQSFENNVNLHCGYRNDMKPNNNMDCACYTQVMSEVTPYEVKVLSDDPRQINRSTKAVLSVMIENTDRIEACRTPS